MVNRHFRPIYGVLSFKAIAFILSLFHIYRDGEEVAWARRKAFDFLHGYSSVPRSTIDPFLSFRSLAFAEWHIRTLRINTISKRKKDDKSIDQEGLHVTREYGKLFSPGGKLGYDLQEIRFSSCLITQPTSHLPLYTLISISDGPISPGSKYTFSKPMGCFAAMGKYILVIYEVISDWGKLSNEFLDKLDDLVRVNVCNSPGCLPCNIYINN